MKRLLLSATLLGSALSAQPAPAPPGQPQQPLTIQAQFDSSTAAIERGAWAEALSHLQALEARVRPADARSRAIIAVRSGIALLGLGRVEEARQAAERGLLALPEGDATLTADRFEALTLLGRTAEGELDYAEAARRFRAAAALPLPDADKLGAYRGLIQTQLFDQPEAAVAAADAALAVIAASQPRNRHLEGEFHTLKGRALLNLGRFPEARRELGTALRLLGNLTLRVDRADLVARGDLALAALLVGNEEDARRYLAYTGQGRFRRGAVPTGQHLLPQCGPALSEDDVAVVEFSIADSGVVGHVMPIYASRGGNVALLFAAAVAHWRFDPEQIQPIPGLLRTVVRVELRCTALTTRRPHIDIPDLARFVPVAPIRRLAGFRASLAAAERSGAAEATVGALIALADQPGIPKQEGLDLLRRALALATEARLDGRLIAGLAIRVGNDVDELEDRRELEEQASSEAIRSIPTAAAAIRLVRASALFSSNRDELANELTAALAATPEVRAHPVLAREADALLAMIRASRRNAAAPSGAAPAGASCGFTPRQRSMNASSSDFPNAALAWGFEGWSAAEPVVRADGRVASARTLIAYPPFVFGDAARNIARRGAYDPLAPGDNACIGERVSVRFLLP